MRRAASPAGLMVPPNGIQPECQVSLSFIRIYASKAHIRMSDLSVPAGNGDLARVRELLDAARGRKFIARKLHGSVADLLAAKNSTGDTALICAARNGHAHICQELLAASTDAAHAGRTGGAAAIVLAARDDIGDTALLCAARCGHLSVCKALLSAGAEANSSHAKGYYTALMLAAIIPEAGQRTSVCQLLLARGADVKATGKDSCNALMWAASSGHADTCGLLLAAGSRVNHRDDNGNTALLLAAKGGHLKVCGLLVSSGAHIDAANKRGDTPLGRAAWGGHPLVCQFLIAEGANVDAAGYVDGWTPLTYAARNGYPEVVHVLASSGAALTASGGRTPLFHALMHRQEAACKALLIAGAPVHQPAEDEREVVKLLSPAGLVLLLASGWDPTHAR